MNSNKLTIFLISIPVAVLFGVLNYFFETSLIPPTDAQGPIAIMFSIAHNAFLVGFFILFLYIFLSSEGQGSKAALVLLTLLLVWAGYSTYGTHQTKEALTANPSTPPDALRILYSTSERVWTSKTLAKNPNTPPDVLRHLYNKPRDVGIDIALARNPNTPKDILDALATREKDGFTMRIIKALEANPSYSKK